MRMLVSLITLGDPGRQTGGYLYHRRLAEAAPDNDATVSFVSLPDRALPLSSLAGRHLSASTRGADVVVVDSIVTAVAGPWLPRLDKPAVGMLHQGPGGIDHGPVRTRIQAVFDRYAYRHLRTLLVASESLRVEFDRLHPDVRVVPPGRNVAAQPEIAPLDLRCGRTVSLLCVANWLPRKGIVELLDAVAVLPDELATLHLVGDPDADPSYGREMRRRVEKLRDRVIVHGSVSKERVAGFYRDADIFVMPSTKEPYGTAYGEAMAAGLPVVGWRAGNLPFLVEDGRGGFLIEPGDVPGLAAVLKRLSGDEELRGEMGAVARERAASFPTWAETARSFFSALREAVAGRTP